MNGEGQQPNQQELGIKPGAEKTSFTRIENRSKGNSPEKVRKAIGEKKINAVSGLIDSLTSSSSHKDLIKQKAKTDPLFKDKRLPESVVMRLAAIDALNDVVQNTNYYQNTDPKNPLLSFYLENKSLLAKTLAADNLTMDDPEISTALDLLKAETIIDYNRQRGEELGGKSLPKDENYRRKIQPQVDVSLKGNLSPAGVKERVMEYVKPTTKYEGQPRGNVWKEKREYEADRMVYQVIKRQLVPPEALLRWKALKDGLLAGEGDPQAQLKTALKEQSEWDEKIKEALEYGSANQKKAKDQSVVTGLNALMQRIGSEGFYSVATDTEKMSFSSLTPNRKNEIMRSLGLSEEQFDKVFSQVARMDENRLTRLDGIKGSEKPSEGRIERLGTETEKQPAIDLSEGKIRERAFKIVNQILIRKQFPYDFLDEPEEIKEKTFVQVTKVKNPKPKPVTPPQPEPKPEPEPEPIIPQPEPVVPPEPVIPPQPEPIEPKLQTELKIGMTAVESKIGQAPEQNREVLEANVQINARQMAEERRAKWEGRMPNLGRGIERFWKHTLGQSATYQKDRGHSVKLLAEAGLNITTIPYSFLEKMDQVISPQLAQERTGLKRFTGWMKDKAHAVTFTENELEQRRVSTMRTLREAAFDANVFQGLNPDIQALCVQFKNILTGDYQASEALGQRVTREIGGELLTIRTAEKRAGEMVEIQGPAREFLISRILTPLVSEGLTSANGQVSEETIFKARGEMQAFFTSKEFIDWYDAQSAQTKHDMDLSLSYGSDFIPMIQETLIPQIRQAAEHLRSTGALEDYLKNVVLKTRVATLQSQIDSAEIGESMVESIGIRRITHERVLNLYQQLRGQGQAPRLAANNLLEIANGRADLLKKAIVPVGATAAVGLGVALGVYAGTRMGSGIATAVMPIVGGSLVGGALRGAQEYSVQGIKMKQHEAESTLGYKFTQDMKGRQELSRFELHKRVMADRIREMEPFVGRLENRTAVPVPANEVLALLGFVAENNARIKISEIRDVRMFKAENPQSYQKDQLELETIQAKAILELKDCIDHDPQIRGEVLQRLGINIPANADVTESIIGQLAAVSQQNIETGAGISVDYQAALGRLTTVTEQEAINRRESTFKCWQRNRAIMTGVKTAAIGMVGGAVSQQLLAEAARHISALSELPIFGGAFKKGQTIGEDIGKRGLNWFGARLGHPELGAGNGGNDAFRDLFPKGGTTEVDGHQFVAHADHSVDILDKTTGQPELGPEFKKIIDSDGNISALGRNGASLPQNFQDSLEHSGFQIKHEDDILVSGNPREIFNPTGQHLDTVTGHGITIPDGTKWIQDTSGKWDLVVEAQPNIVLVNNASFEANGHMNFDASGSEYDPREIIETHVKGGESVIHKPVFGPDGEWTKGSTNVDHRQWYSYDQPGSQGNELGLHTLKSGDSVVLDINHMGTAYQKDLVPNPIDVQEVIKSHQAGWYFSTPKLPQDGVWVSDGADGVWDGKLTLNPNDVDPTHLIQTSHGSIQLGEFSKIVINSNAVSPLSDGDIATELTGRQDVFNLGQDGKPGFIEAGRVVAGKDGNILQAFASIKGTHQIGDSVDIHIKGPDIDSVTVPGKNILRGTEELMSVFKIIPPPEEAPPGIPTPFSINRPLEAPEDVIGPGYTPTSKPIIIPETERRRQELEQKKQEGNITPEEQAELERLTAETETASNLTQRFQSIPGEVVRENNPFFVENPPGEIELTDEQIASLAFNPQEPFFVNIKQDSLRINKNVAPWAWTLGKTPDNPGDERFIKAEASTDNDSGLLAVCAASAQTPEQQAKLYRAISQAVLRIHENPQVLREWLQRQNEIDQGNASNSLDIFFLLDHGFIAQGVVQNLRPENERLVTLTDEMDEKMRGKGFGGQDPEILDTISQLWQPRILELREALQRNKLEEHHLRWIEFLSHSVNVPELINMAQKQNPSPAPQPTVGQTSTDDLNAETETTIPSTEQQPASPAGGWQPDREKEHLYIESMYAGEPIRRVTLYGQAVETYDSARQKAKERLGDGATEEQIDLDPEVAAARAKVEAEWEKIQPEQATPAEAQPSQSLSTWQPPTRRPEAVWRVYNVAHETINELTPYGNALDQYDHIRDTIAKRLGENATQQQIDNDPQVLTARKSVEEEWEKIRPKTEAPISSAEQQPPQSAGGWQPPSREASYFSHVVGGDRVITNYGYVVDYYDRVVKNTKIRLGSNATQEQIENDPWVLEARKSVEEEWEKIKPKA